MYTCLSFSVYLRKVYIKDLHLYHPLSCRSRESVLSSAVSLTSCPHLIHLQFYLILALLLLKCFPNPFTCPSVSTVSTLGYHCFSHKIQLPSDWPPCPRLVNSHSSPFPSSVAAWPETFPKCKSDRASLLLNYAMATYCPITLSLKSRLLKSWSPGPLSFL